jgi:hypothetical protein
LLFGKCHTNERRLESAIVTVLQLISSHSHLSLVSEKIL